MSRRVVDKAFVDGLVDSLAAHPHNFAAAGRAAGCDARTIKLAYLKGYPKYGVPPLAELVAERQAAARALALRNDNAAIEAKRDAQKEINLAASLDAAKDTEREGQIARASRDNALALQAVSMNLAQRGHKMAQNLTEQEMDDLTTVQKLKALKTIAEFNEKAALVAEKAIHLHRLIMGEPTAHVNHEHRHDHAHVHTNVAPDEMVEIIARAQVAVERAKSAGIIDAEVVQKV